MIDSSWYKQTAFQFVIKFILDLKLAAFARITSKSILCLDFPSKKNSFGPKSFSGLYSALS